MKVTFAVSDLKGLKGLAGIASSNRNIAAWRFLLVDPSKGTITASNDSIVQVSRVAMKSDDQQAFLIDAERFGSIVSALPGDATLDLSVEKDSITLTSKRSRYKIQTIDIAQYSMPEKPGDIVSVSLEGAHLSCAIDSTASFAATNDVRACLNGVYIEHTGNTFKLTATNGHQLSHAEFEAKKASSTEHRGVLVGVDFMRSIQRHCEGEVSVFFSENKIGFANGNTLVWGRLISHPYPDYTKLLNIPDTSVALKPLSDLFKGAVARIRPLLSKKTTGVTLKSDGKNVLRLVIDGDLGSGEDEFEVEVGQPFQTKMNANYLENVLRIYDGALDVFLPTTRSQGAFFKGEIGGIRLCQVIMPMND